jgi:hypothetical protein
MKRAPVFLLALSLALLALADDALGTLYQRTVPLEPPS